VRFFTKITIFILIAFFCLPLVSSLVFSTDGIQLTISHPIEISHAGLLFDIPSFSDLVDTVLSSIASLILSILGLILWAAGILFNIVVEITIIKMGALVSPQSMPAIERGWTIIRDLVNISFIFVLLYAGIQTILDTGIKTGEVVKNVIIAALFINFSLFFTQALIDVSNITATQFYKSIGSAYTSDEGFDIDNADSGLSHAIMQNLKLQTIYSSTSNNILIDIQGAAVNYVGRLIVGALIIVITSTLFFIASIMLIARFVILIMLLITSPVGYLGTLLPKLGSSSKKWWDTFTDQLIFAPALMLFLFIAIQISSSLNRASGAVFSGGSNGGLLDFAGGTAASLLPLINTCISLAFFIGVIVVAKSVSGASGKTVTKHIGGFVAGSVGKVGRKFGSQAGERVQGSQYLQKNLESDNAIRRGAARLALRGGKSMAEGTWDMRAPLAKVPGTDKDQFGKALTGKDLEKKRKAQADKDKAGLDVPYSIKRQTQLNLENAQKKKRELSGTLTGTNKEISDLESLITKHEQDSTNYSPEDRRRKGIDQQISRERANLQNKKQQLAQEKKAIGLDDVEMEIKKAQEKNDDIFGVDEKEAKKRAGKKADNETQEEYDKRVESLKKDNIETRRAKERANKLENRGFFTRVITGQTKKNMRDRAKTIRDSFKKENVKDAVQKLMEESGELTKKDDSSEGDTKDKKE